MNDPTDLLRSPGSRSEGHIPEGCVLRYYRDGDEEPLVDLLKATYRRWPSVASDVPPVDHLHWKLRSTPDSPRYHVVAELQSRIIACRFFIVQSVRMGDRVLTVRQGTDTSVHPEFQGTGLMTAMTYPLPPRLRDEFDADLSINSDAKALHSIRRHDERKNAYARVDVLTAEVQSDAERAGVPVDMSLVQVPHFDRNVTPFVAQASAPFWCIVDRTPDYLNWRFADPRAGAFTILLARDERRILGYVVLGASGVRGRIADLLILPGRDDVLNALLSHAMTKLRDSGASSVECWATPSHPYRDVLSALGFERARRTVEFYCQPLRVPDAAVASFGDPRTRIHLMSGDTDLV
jgi:hypothetical protein